MHRISISRKILDQAHRLMHSCEGLQTYRQESEGKIAPLREPTAAEAERGFNEVISDWLCLTQSSAPPFHQRHRAALAGS